MNSFAEFHWWYVPLGLLALFLLFGKKKGGVVVERLEADFDILDDRFADSRPEADYCTFKAGTPDHIDIELENLPVPVGETVELLLNGSPLATVPVKRNREAEFDHWSDEAVDFPKVKVADELTVRYQGASVMKGVFR
ncbi:MAG: hypothetical protein AAGJ52_03470 [Pseudomonadota bacterium]